MDRRTYLALMATAIGVGLAGCGGGDGNGDAMTSPESTAPPATTTTETETMTETETDKGPQSDPASFGIVSVNAPDKVDVGEEHTFSITVKNTGDRAGTFESTLQVSVLGTPSWEDVGTITLKDIPPGGTRTWESNPTAFDEAMTVQFRLGETEWQYEVVPVQPDVQIQQHGLVVDQGEYSTDVYVAATVTNEGDAAASRIALKVNWFDEDGNYIDDSLGVCHVLGAGETWAAHVGFSDTEPDRVGDYEITIDGVGGTPTKPDGVVVTDSRLLVGDDDVKVTGTVENGHNEALDYLKAAVKFHDSDGVVLFTEYTNTTDVASGETWDFEVEALFVDRLNQVESYEVVLSASIY